MSNQNTQTSTQEVKTFARKLARAIYRSDVIVQLPLLLYYHFKVKPTQDTTLTILITSIEIKGVAEDFDVHLEIEVIVERQRRKRPVVEIKFEAKSHLETENTVEFKVKIRKPKSVPFEYLYEVIKIFKKVRLAPPPRPEFLTIELY